MIDRDELLRLYARCAAAEAAAREAREVIETQLVAEAPVDSKECSPDRVLVPLQEVAREFGFPDDLVRKWTIRHGLGEKQAHGRWFVDQNLFRRFIDSNPGKNFWRRRP
jgi:hypothetical protein